MRKVIVWFAALAALSAGAQQRIKTDRPVVKPGPVAAPSVKALKLPSTLKLELPTIESVERSGTSPGPAADRVLFNGEAIRVRGRNFGLPAEGYRLALRRSGRLMPLRLNPNVQWTSTTIAAYVPAASEVRDAGLGEMVAIPEAFEVVLLDRDNKATASRKVTFHSTKDSYTEDFDGDGVSVERNDCNDFDRARYPGAIEVCDREGVDEDCDYLTFGEADRDGDNFMDAMCFNPHPGRLASDGTLIGGHNRRIRPDGREVIGGRDCDDTDATANPIRPENCPPNWDH